MFAHNNSNKFLSAAGRLIAVETGDWLRLMRDKDLGIKMDLLWGIAILALAWVHQRIQARDSYNKTYTDLDIMAILNNLSYLI